MSPATIPSGELSRRLAAKRNRAGLIGAIALLLCVLLAGAHAGWTQFCRSYLLAYVFWVAIPLGMMAILMLHHLTSGWWGYPLRRIFEAGSRTIWVMALLFIPILIGIPRLYAWVSSSPTQGGPFAGFKHAYLSPAAFILRAVGYFAVWVLLASCLNRWSARQDATGDPYLKEKMRMLSAPGLVLWSFLVTFAAVDWVMSLEAQWFSTIYGMLFMVIDALAGLSFTIIVLRRLWKYDPVRGSIQANHFNDIGNIEFTFLMLWAYLSFDQLLVIWAGNLKDEIPWYTQRVFGGWKPVGIFLLLGHFFLPFFLLLMKPLKRRLERLASIAAWMILMAVVDIWWLVVPSFANTAAHPRFYLTDALAIIGLGGIWLALFMRELGRMPLLPLHDPRFARAPALEHGHAD